MHALTGCDIVSAFYVIEKKTALDVWRSMPHLYAIFARLSRAPSHVSDTDMDEIHSFYMLSFFIIAHLHASMLMMREKNCLLLPTVTSKHSTNITCT